VNSIRNFLDKNPIIGYVIAVAVLGLAVWRVTHIASGPGAARPVTPPPAATSPAVPNPAPATTAVTPPPAAPPAPVPATPAPQAPASGGVPVVVPGGPPAGTQSGQAPGLGTAPSQQVQTALAAGRPDPFVPLVGNAARPAAGGGLPLPPVPPLLPGGTPPGGGGVNTAPAPPAVPALRVTGILRNASALAIIEDAQGAHIVGAGDLVGPGVRVVAIDAGRGVVELNAQGTNLEVPLQTPAPKP